MVFDEPGEVALQLGHVPIAGLPTTVIVDKSGKVAAVYFGARAAKDLEPVLDTLLNETSST